MLLYDSRQAGGTLENLYICFEPNAKNTITVQNKDDYPLNLFLIKQGDQAAKVEVHLLERKKRNTLGKSRTRTLQRGSGYGQTLRMRTHRYSIIKEVEVKHR